MPAPPAADCETMKRFSISLLLALAALALGYGLALAQDPTPAIPDDAVNAIARQLYCPVCESTPLDVCPTQACAEWRELIREKLAQGQSETQIKQYFVDRYGDHVLAVPPARGLNWLVYLIPPVAILAGVFLVYRALRSFQAGVQPVAAPPAAASNQPGDDPYIDRLEEELKKL